MAIDRDNARALIAEARDTDANENTYDLLLDLADALESALSAVPVEGDREALTELQEAFDAAGQMPQGTMTHDQWKVFARLYNAAEHVAYPLSRSPLPVEGEVEWEYGVTCPPEPGFECTYPHPLESLDDQKPEETLWRRRITGDWEVAP